MAVNVSGKILRIGVLQEGRIVEERFMRKKETITVGDTPKCTFILPFAQTPLAKRFPLFPYSVKGYELSFTESMKGKITLDGNVHDLSDLIKSGKARKKEGLFSLPLTESMRGKVSIGDVTILFTFVKAPPLPARPKLPSSLRQGWVKSFDWIFVAFLFASFLVHGGVLGYATSQTVPKEAKLDDAIPERLIKLMQEKLPKKEDVAKDTGGEKEKEKKDDKKKDKDDGKKKDTAAPEQRKAMTPEEVAEAAARRKAEIAKKVAGMGLNQIIGSKGPGDNSIVGAVADTMSEGSRATDIGATMEGVTGVGIAQNANDRSKRGTGNGGPETKEIGKSAVSEGGREAMGGRKEAEIKAETKLGNFEVEGTLDQQAVARIVKRNQASITACFESELRRDPKLHGKISVDIVIAASGKVSKVDVTSNTTTNKGLESCVTDTVRRWRFPAPTEGEATISTSFVFEALR